MLELSGSVAGCLPGRNRMVQGLRHFTMPGSHRLGLLGGQGVKHLIAPRAIRSDFQLTGGAMLRGYVVKGHVARSA